MSVGREVRQLHHLAAELTERSHELREVCDAFQSRHGVSDLQKRGGASYRKHQFGTRPSSQLQTGLERMSRGLSAMGRSQEPLQIMSRFKLRGF